MVRARYIFTKAWIMAAATVCIIRPTGSLKPGVIMFLLTPFALIADIVRQRFGALLGRKPSGSVQGR